MATTTNFGWTTPDNTDLVKDGAAAIRTLGSAIDTSFVDLKGGTTGQVLKKTSNTDLDFEWGTASSGLTLLNTTTFTTVASQSVDSVFNSTYNYYKILIVITASSADDNTLTMRLRASATDTTTNYNHQRMYISGSFVQDTNGSGTDEWNISLLDKDQAYETAVELNLYNPYLAQTTAFHTFNAGAAAGASYIMGSAGRQLSSTVFDGFKISALSGTMSGVVKTYGFQ